MHVVETKKDGKVMQRKCHLEQKPQKGKAENSFSYYIPKYSI